MSENPIIILCTDSDENAKRIILKIGFNPSFYLWKKMYVWGVSPSFDFPEFFTYIRDATWDNPEKIQIIILEDDRAPRNFFIDSRYVEHATD